VEVKIISARSQPLTHACSDDDIDLAESKRVDVQGGRQGKGLGDDAVQRMGTTSVCEGLELSCTVLVKRS
jgi:hypothetical protein